MVDGAADGATVLLIMGLAQSLIFWPDDCVAALNEAGFRTVRFNVRTRPGTTLDRSVEFWRRIGTKNSGTTDAERRALLEASFERGHNPAGVERLLDAIIDTGDLRRHARKIAAPTLVLRGSEDPLAPREGGVDIFGNVDGAKLEIVEGMGRRIQKMFRARIAARLVEHCGEGAGNLERMRNRRIISKAARFVPGVQATPPLAGRRTGKSMRRAIPLQARLRRPRSLRRRPA